MTNISKKYLTKFLIFKSDSDCIFGILGFYIKKFF